MKIFTKPIALILLIAFVNQLFFPSISFASTGGPIAPDFSGFESVTANNMVDNFNGTFTYNLPIIEIPGPDGGSYALSMSYHSGSSPTQEASWVGDGWSLNPGSISRNVRGVPDDVNGLEVTHYNQVPANWTAGIGASYGFEDLELFGVDIPLDLSINTQLQFNSYKGFSLITTPYVGFTLGMYSLGYTFQDYNKGSWSYSVNPGAILASAIKNNTKAESEAPVKSEKTVRLLDNTSSPLSRALNSSQFLSSSYNMYSRPTNTMSYTGVSARFTLSGQVDVSFIPAGGECATLFGTFTMQAPTTEESLKHYGYLYSAGAGDEDIMDYVLEKETPFNKRNYYMSIPYSQPDIFNVSAEGLGGSFRFYSRNAGHFHPNAKKSETFSGQLGLELEAGMNIGPGGDIGGSYNSLEVSGYGDDGYTFNADGDEAFYAAFEGDQVMNADFGTEEAEQASMNQTKSTPGLMEYEFKIPSAIEKTSTSNEDRIARSSFIISHTNVEMSESDVSGKAYNSYSLSDSIDQWIDRSGTEIQDGLGEIAVYNNTGLRYVYGLPVYSRNEMNLQFGVSTTDANVTLDHNSIAYKSDVESDAALKKVGTEDHNAYAANFLLTEITTPDYVDRTWDGPSSDDFGGYVKFNYRQQIGNGSGSKTGGNFYQWRIPYSGLLYNKGQLSDMNDDMGFVSTGQREVYYTSSIDTKTHIAFFYTSDRNDGVEAKQASTSNESGFYEAIKQDYFDATYSSSANKLQKLDSIYLYVKNPDGTISNEVIKRVYFKYDYSLWPGQPNTISSADGTGKLTLKNVWVEAENTHNARVNPYTFTYTYPANGTYPSQYTSLDDYGNSPALNQTPSYSNFLCDRWGYYQEDGENKYENMFQWLDQDPSSSFDPAAWQLKQIQLPAGGEIHIQYEQNDYRYVQDRLAMVMVPLKKSVEVTGVNDDVYSLNLDSLGLTSDDYAEVADQIQKELIDKDQKIYFKFLYGFQGTNTPALDECNSEYISGYVNIEEVSSDAAGVYLKLGTADEDEYTNPREVCLDNYYTQHNGFDVSACSFQNFDLSDATSLLYEMLEEMTDVFEISGENECLSVNEEYSYLRIPIVNDKKGGGIRVKRILTFDEGLESDKVLYGKEYIYKTSDGHSSGVATNEPSSGGDESALKTFLLPASDADWTEKAISGDNKEQMEGPIGEYLLPGASVGYSRVVVRNIYEGINNDGFNVSEFYTVKDFPFDGDWNYTNAGGETEYKKGASHTSIDQKQDWLPIYAVLINTFISNLWCSQGYSFIQNNMHGQPKSSATYMGSYANLPSEDNTQLIASSESKYFEPGEPIPVMNKWNDIEKKQLGKQMEVVFESRAVKDQTTDVSAEFDVSVGFLPVPPFSIPFITVIPSLSYIEQELYTHVTTSITKFPVYVKEVKTFHDGVWTTSSNKIFDANTGAPLITESHDDFNGLMLNGSPTAHQGYYYNYSFPAAQQYEDMGGKYIGDGFEVNTADYDDLKIYYLSSGGDYITFQGDICAFADKFAPGDLLAIDFESEGVYFYQSAGINGTTMEIYPVEGFTTIPSTYSGYGISSITIVRSGRPNELATMIGNIIVYGDEKLADNNFSDYKSVKSVDANYITEWNKRKSFAASLTTQMSSGNTASVNYNIPNIHVTGYTGSCDPMNLNVQYVFQADTLVQMRVNDNCIEYLTPGGTFSMDSACGKLIYYPPGAECSPATIECIVFCPGIYPVERIADVITASAKGLSDEWELDNDIASIFDIDMNAVENPFSIASKGKWRAKTSNSYREDISAITDANGRIYNSGIFIDSLDMYNFLYEEANNDTFWLPGVTQTMYSPYGTGMEGENIAGIKKVTKKGYGFTVPYLVADNAAYQSVYHVSFESSTDDGSYLKDEDDFQISESNADYGAGQFGALAEDTAHSGSNSYRLGLESVTKTITMGGGGKMPSYTITLFSYDTTELAFKTIPLDDQIESDGLTVKLWLRVENSDEDPSDLTLNIENTSYPTRNKSISFDKISRVGEWTLYTAKTGAFNASVWSGSITPVIQLKHETQNVLIYVDDIRIQPTTAKATAYIYDPATFKIVTILDDINLGLYYQYDQEGKLVRKLKETERGIKTTQETQYNIPKQDRP